MIATEAVQDAAPHRAMRSNLRQLASDVVTLMELQAELVQVDLREWFKGMVWFAVLAASALVLALAAIPVLLFSLAYYLEDVTDLSLAASLLISGGGAILAAGVCIAIAVSLLKRDQKVLQRSAGELRRNVRWLKEVLSSQPMAAAE